jgi:hypothetical protein
MNNRKILFTLSALGSIVLLFGQGSALAACPDLDCAALIDTSAFSPPSPDPSGIAYLSTGSSAGHLLISDGEVEEMAIYAGSNLFEIDLSGNLLRPNPSDPYHTTATTTSYSNPNAYSNEPAGMAFNPVNGHLFVSDDNQLLIFEIDPGLDGVLHTGDDIRTSFSIAAFGSNDPEGLAFDPGILTYPDGVTPFTEDDTLYIADGVNAEIYKVLPGPDGQFNTAGDNQVTHFDTLGLGVEDPEGIEFEPPNRLYVVGEPTTQMAHLYTAGPLIRMVDISAANAKKTAGLAIGPSSDPLDDPAVSSVYIAARGVDNDIDPNENDGKVYEFSVPPLSPDQLGAPGVAAGPEQTIFLPNSADPASANLDGTVVDDGLPGPVTTTWSQVSGPGTVIFTDPNVVDTTASFSTDGEYVLRLTANDGAVSTSHDVTILVRPPFSAGFQTIYISSMTGGSAGGVSFKDEDIIAYDTNTHTWSMYFDGSDVGLNVSSGVDIDAFKIMADGTILLSFESPTTITIDGTATLVDDSDIVRFTPAATCPPPMPPTSPCLGVDTAGTYEWYFDGSDVGLDLDGEDIDAIAFTAGGNLAVSTVADFTVSGVSGKDEDLIVFTASNFGAETSGTWAMHFDGSDVGLSQSSSEDVNGVWIDSNNGANSDIYLTARGAFSVTGVSGGGDDIFKCTPGSTGSATTCSYAFTWDGINSGLPAGMVLDGIELVR